MYLCSERLNITMDKTNNGGWGAMETFLRQNISEFYIARMGPFN